MKYAIGVFALCATVLTSTSSFASLEFCNHRTDGEGIWIATSMFFSGINNILEVDDANTCFNDQLSSEGGTCYFTTWRTDGWWHITPNQCVTTYGNDLTNRYQYVFAQLDTGEVYTQSTTATFWVHNPAFSWDQYVGSVQNGSCALQQGGNLSVCSDAFQETFSQLDTGSSKSYILNLH